MPRSPHRPRADVLSPHQVLDRKVASTSFVSTVRHALSVEAARTLVHAFVISRVNYSNSIFESTSAVHLRPLHCVLNAPARFVVKRRKFDCITESLHDELHWLPVHAYYKICLLVYKCSHGPAPSYLIEQCIPVAVNPARSSLRSASNSDLMYPRTNLVCYGQRSFSVIGPRTWNQFAPNIRDPSLSFDNFCRRLKTVLFNRAPATYYYYVGTRPSKKLSAVVLFCVSWWNFSLDELAMAAAGNERC